MKTLSSSDFSDLPARSLVTIPEAADFFRVSPKTMYSWVDRGYIGARRFGGSLRIPVAEIIRIYSISTESTQK